MSAAQYSGHAQIFINIWPVNAFAITEQLPVRSLRWRGVKQAWKPSEGNTYSAAIGK